jgi:hypothetical protein
MEELALELECLAREYAHPHPSASTNVALVTRKGLKLPKTHSSMNTDAAMMKDVSGKFCSMADKSR